MTRRSYLAFLLCCSLGSLIAAAADTKAPPEPVKLQITGNWQVQVTLPATTIRPEITQRLAITPPAMLSVVSEKYNSLPMYNPQGPMYAKGAKLLGLKAAEVAAPDLLDPASVVVRLSADATGETMQRGKDYEFEPRWGGIGRVPESRIAEGQPVFISYRHTLQRLDSIILTAGGNIIYRNGTALASTPLPPELQPGEERLANVWFTKPASQLNDNMLFPILELAYPEPPPVNPSLAEQYIPRTMEKLKAGEPVRILAWGDSVTACGYLANQDRWQEQFVTRLRERFPQAQIELVTEAWGGRNTGSYLAVPPGQPHNYKELVLGAKPDVIISEFVNDAGLSPEKVETVYSKLLADFQQIQAEWIILTPHYVRPDWMGLDRERDVDQDPRPYVQGLRQFSQKHHVALADASLRYGRLWRQGIPYNSLMTNCINHPDARGLRIFADALMQLFPSTNIP